MVKRCFERTVELEASPAEVFRWHHRAGAFDRLTPPWLKVVMLDHGQGVANGSTVTIRVKKGLLGLRWTLRHAGVRDPDGFEDYQVRGPFAHWHHRHRFEALSGGGTRLTDHIEYALPGGAWANKLGGPMIDRDLSRLFTFRHAITQADMAGGGADLTDWTILVSGATGLVGRALCARLTTAGAMVRKLSRSAGENTYAWNIERGEIDPAALEGCRAVIHLAGEPIARRWTPAVKQAIRQSRVDGTALLARAISRLERPPEVFISASAIGYYGDTDERLCAEDAPPGAGFLAEVCAAWEAAAEPAKAKGVRVVHPRIGVVLSPEGGALAKLLPVFKSGLGGPIGSGDFYMSWIGREDLVEVMLHLLRTAGLEGPVNAVAPSPVTNAEFSQTLAGVLHRPACVPVPPAMLRLAYGEMARETVLASARIQPARLEQSGFRWRHPDLAAALKACLP